MPSPFRLSRSAALAAALVGSLVAVAPAAAAAADAHTLHTVHVGGVALRVPAGWHVVTRHGVADCIVDRGAPEPTAEQAAYGENDCQLQVFVGTRLPDRADADELYFPGDPAQCVRGASSVDWHTVAATRARVGGVAAEYRRFAIACLGRPAEQWFVGRQPGVLIQRTRSAPATEAAAGRAVASATLPAGHGLPRAFTGTPRGTRDTGVLLAPTRIAHGPHGGAAATGTSGGSRLFRVPAGLRASYTDRNGARRTLSRSELFRDVHQGFPHSGGLQPEFTVRSALGSGRLASIDVSVASTS